MCEIFTRISLYILGLSLIMRSYRFTLHIFRQYKTLPVSFTTDHASHHDGILEVALLVHLLDDVYAADEVAVHVELGVGWPV